MGIAPKIVAAAAVALATGCGTAPAAGGGGSAALTLGGAAADGSFVPLSDGESVSLIPGAQGGFHVWMSWQLDGAPAGDAILERTAHRVSDGASVLRTLGDVALTGGGDASPGPIPMFMCPTPIGVSVVGEAIVYRLTFVDEAGAEIAHREVTLVPHCPDGDAFCRQICTG